MSIVAELRARITPPNALVALRTQHKLDLKTKPRRSLGRLEDLACQYAAISGSDLRNSAYGQRWWMPAQRADSPRFRPLARCLQIEVASHHRFAWLRLACLHILNYGSRTRT